MPDRMKRAVISAAKQPLLDAILRILEERKRFRPLSDRQIHYPLLNDPPLIHASKPDSVYRNDKASYRALCELLTRARVAGLIPMEWIADPTRPVVSWTCYPDPQPFIRKELSDFLTTYWRNLMRSQPCHVEIVGEKNTIIPIIRPVAAEFTIPYTIGRGYCSLRPRYDLVQRFLASGKDRLVLLFLSDFDPDGEMISESFSRSIRDDFHIAENRLSAIKVGLTYEQTQELELPPAMEAKKLSKNYPKFAAKYGDAVYELEAVSPSTFQGLLRDAIKSVIDVDLFNQELEQEQRDAAFLEGVRRQVLSTLKEMDLGMDENAHQEGDDDE